jgi:putative glutathione S-transferase
MAGNASGSGPQAGSWTTSIDKSGAFQVGRAREALAPRRDAPGRRSLSRADASLIPRFAQRKPSSFRSAVTADGSSGFKAEAGRYHLYVSFACPWAHRTLVVRKLKGLEAAISYTVVDWHLREGGWRFTDQKPGCERDPLHNFEFLRQVYSLTDASYEGNITVPVLFDKKTDRIVNNESAEIIRMLNSEFNAFSASPRQAALDLYPAALRGEIDATNEWVYATINNGVYRCGFATTQEAYEEAFHKLFASLDRAEAILSKSRFLCGNTLTEADVRLFTTLVRFDPVYVLHFKCNLRRIRDYPALSAYLRDLYQLPGVRETVNMEHIKKHYVSRRPPRLRLRQRGRSPRAAQMVSHTRINPLGIVALGPELDYDSPPSRDALGPAPAL